MNDKNKQNQTDSDVYSLRQRYLFVSSAIVLLIFAFAWLAQNYVSSHSAQHQQSIELRHQASQYIRQLRNEVLHVEKGLEAFMWNPSDSLRQEVHHNINSALHHFDLLRLHDWITKSNNVEVELGDFALDLKALHISLDRVMDMRLEKPVTTQAVTRPASDINQAAQRFSASGEALGQSSPLLTAEIDTIFTLWRQLQQQVKTYLDSSSDSLSDEETLTQQQKIEAIYQQIDKQLETVAQRPSITANPGRQQLLTAMLESLNLWHINLEGVKQNHNHDSWRNDIHYLKHTIEPQFKHLWEYLNKLDSSIDKFSQSEATELGNVANLVAKVVWILCFFGLAVISVAYLYFQSTVLHPIATLARAFKSDAAGEHVAALPEVYNLETRHLIDAYRDMHQQVQDRQQALEHIAMHDSLTALPNRYHLMGNLQTLCESSQQNQAVFAVIMLGLDRFKEINDTLGQYTGDAILKKYGQRLHCLLRESDSIARFAGDEFAVLLPGASREEALYVARKIHREMEPPIDVDGISLSISSSIGIALYPDNGKEKEELTRRANIAMAIAKQHKTGIALYEKRYDTSSVERLSLADKLRQAIHSRELHLCFQPQLSVHNQELSGVEVLCRWNDPLRGLISPEEFIPVAEHTGQIHLITEWVVDTALQQAGAWRDRGLDCGVLAINISPFNLHAPNFYSMLETQLKKWNYPAARLMLEITETAMMADPAHAIKTLGRLRELGLKFSIDDYGTGFSSLSYLKQLPVDELKIDKSFVMEMTTDENDAVIVRSTIELAHNLGLKVVAEGVDTQEKQDLLEVLDCDYMQGFHTGRPMSAEQLEQRLPPLKGKYRKVQQLKDFR